MPQRLCRLFLIIASVVAATAASAVEVRPFLRGGYDTGGDTLVTVNFIGGETEKIKANEGLFGAAGASFMNDAQTLEFEFSVGFKFNSIDADNGDVDWKMMPVEALLFYRIPSWRFGGGLAYHLGPELDGDGVIGGLNVEFKDAIGYVLQADFLIKPNMAVGARYTDVKYEPKPSSGATGSARSGGLGAVFTYRF
jgi:hypothetical protein